MMALRSSQSDQSELAKRGPGIELLAVRRDAHNRLVEQQQQWPLVVSTDPKFLRIRKPHRLARLMTKYEVA